MDEDTDYDMYGDIEDFSAEGICKGIRNDIEGNTESFGRRYTCTGTNYDVYNTDEIDKGTCTDDDSDEGTCEEIDVNKGADDDAVKCRLYR
jgi:hypothetical protein